MASNSYFNEFSKLLVDGQKIANDTGRTHLFIWRGYKACISSQLPKLSNHEIKRRFDLAMQSIKKDEENFKKPTATVSLPPPTTTFSGRDNMDVGELTPSSASQPSTSSGSQPCTSSGSHQSSSSLESQEPTQIPETQFEMEGNINIQRCMSSNK